jgi:alcohol dehydrogenase (cytochrome c)
MKHLKITSRAWASVALMAVLIVISVPVTATLYWKLHKEMDTQASDGNGKDILKSIQWRLQLYARKAMGGVPEFTWGELWQMTRHQGGFGLKVMARGGSADSAIETAENIPYNSDDDHQAGAHIFAQRCAMCHGSGGMGLTAPPLNHAGLKHGDRKLSIYKVLRDGIPGTAMSSTNLSWSERWQVVNYLKTLMVHSAIQDAFERIRPNINVSNEQLRSAGSKPDEWLTYSGSLDGQRFTPLTEITPANVSQLRLRWVQQFDTNDTTIEATPLVVGGVIFTTELPSNVVAIDVKSGKVIWRYVRPITVNVSLCCGRVNRGLAILHDRVFLGSLDGYLIAINANTGEMIWQTRVADTSIGETMTGAPLVVNESVVVGVAGGDSGIRGFLAAYDASTGQQQWKFDTIPGPGQPGHETWTGDSDAWKTGGGATWITGSYDASLDLLYWGVGNPAPAFSGDPRPGDDLFTNSVIALHASTGKLAWYFQFTPHDEHDWDSNQTPVLTDLSINGVRHKVICWFNRNGFYYVLDRVTGKFLLGVPFVEQTWAKGFDLNGRPIPTDANKVTTTGQLTRPTAAGGTNWQNPAFDPSRRLIFVHATEGAGVFTKTLIPVSPKNRLPGPWYSSLASYEAPLTLVVRALDVASGTRKWEHFAPPLGNSYYSGLLATGGGLVFGAEGGTAFALDSSTGREVWRLSLGEDTRAAPISFTVDGRQVVLLSADRALFLLGL